MKLLLIDNYDSFTYNLVHYFAELGAVCDVVRNDAISAAQAAATDARGIVISPGPATPSEAGICLELITQLQGAKPLLGVCLGHQAIGQAFGGKVIRAPQPMHGKTSPVTHTDHTMFADIPSPFTATRYHSLVVERASLPESLEVTAQTEDGLIMAMAHRTLPITGVQFHPESIASEHGHTLLKNFLQTL